MSDQYGIIRKDGARVFYSNKKARYYVSFSEVGAATFTREEAKKLARTYLDSSWKIHPIDATVSNGS